MEGRKKQTEERKDGIKARGSEREWVNNTESQRNVRKPMRKQKEEKKKEGEEEEEEEEKEEEEEAPSSSSGRSSKATLACPLTP